VLADHYGLGLSSSAVGFISSDHPIPVNDMVLPCCMICNDGLVLLFICGFLTYACKPHRIFWLHFFFCSPTLIPKFLADPGDLVYALANFFIIHPVFRISPKWHFLEKSRHVSRKPRKSPAGFVCSVFLTSEWRDTTHLPGYDIAVSSWRYCSLNLILITCLHI